MIKTFLFKLDIEKEYNNRMYSVNSNDLKTVKFTFVITDNGIPLDLTGLTVRIAIRKPDKKAVWQDCTVTNAPKGEAEVILDNQAYIKKGEHEAELMLYKGTDTVAITQKFHYRAAEGIMSDKSLKSETVLGPIDQKLAKVEETLSDIRKNGTGIDAQARQDIEEVTTQLADTVIEQETLKVRSATPKTLKTLVTFQFDDGYIYDRTLLKPIFDKHGVKFSMALVPSIIKGTDNRYMRLNECLNMYNQGFEVLSHTMNHLELGKLTDEQQEYELSESKKQLEQMGFGKIESIIYPFGSYNAKTLEIARKHYRSGDTVNGGINTSPIDTYKIMRHGLAASGANKTLAQYKAIVDSALASKGWLVFYSHGIEYHNDPSQLQILDELIAYIKSLNIDIVPVKEAIDLFENKIDVGIKDTNHFKVGADGRVESSFLTPYLKQNVSTKKYTNASPITEFPKGEITVSTHGIADNTGFPLAGGSGILTTYRIFPTDDLSMQTFDPLNGTQFAKRKWNPASSTWGSWIFYEQNRLTRGTVECDFGTVSANSFKYVTVPFTGASPTRAVTVNPTYGVANGVLWNALSDTADSIKIRVYNPTASDIVVGNRTWAISLTNIS